ncbi:hypothetical protein [Thermogutta terrifontis]|nr:hypothetical protein [Thermogutta terrifontis]
MRRVLWRAVTGGMLWALCLVLGIRLGPAAEPQTGKSLAWMAEEGTNQNADQEWPLGTWDRAASQGEPIPTQGTAPCCEICGAGYDCPHLWSWYNGAKILNRGRARPKLLSVDALGNGRLNTSDANFDVAGGYETRVLYYLGNDRENRDQFIEFVYWGLNEWKDTQAVRGERVTYNSDLFGGTQFTAGDLFSFYGLLDFNYADTHQIRYESEINNFELNWWFKPRPRPDRLALLPNGRWQRQCQPGMYFNYAVGFRSLSFDEGFTFDSRGIVITDSGPESLYARQTIWTQNDTFGIQLAGEIMFRRHRFEWGARVKAAPMFNWAEQFTDFALAHPPNHITRYAKDDDVSFMGEVSIVANYRLWDRVRVFGAYDMMWLDGVALAPEQVDFTLLSPGRINDNGTVFFQGVSLGFDVVW